MWASHSGGGEIRIFWDVTLCPLMLTTYQSTQRKTTHDFNIQSLRQLVLQEA